MEINILEKVSLDDITFIGALPDMGRVGGLVTSHLVQKLNTTKIADIILQDKPWINQQKGIINLPNDKYELWIDKDNKIVIFTGNNQPHESASVMNLTEQVMKKIQDIGRIKLIITAGGYLPAEDENNQEVFGVATDNHILDKLKQVGVSPMGPDVSSITWFNGLILGFAKKKGLDGIGLFGMISDSESPQFETVSNIVKIIEKITQTKIDTSELDKKAIPTKKEENREGPGIG